MTEESPTPASSAVFVSQSTVDGAEVGVTMVSNAIVSNMVENKETFAVTVKASHLKWPITAYINKKDTQVIEMLDDSWKNGSPARIRLETKRKYNIDKTVPFANLGKTEVVKIIAGANGKLTSEALTNPQNDPGRTKNASTAPQSSQQATPQTNTQTRASNPSTTRQAGSYNEGKGMNTVDIRRQALQALKNASTANYLRPETTELMKAIALVFGASAEEIVNAGVPDDLAVPYHQGRADESPAWKLYNADGALNVGNYGVVAVSSILLKTKQTLIAVNKVKLPEDKLVRTLTQLVQYITDLVQRYAYKNLKPVNRLANSYTGILQVVLEVITFNGGFPVSEEGELLPADTVKDWVRVIGTEAKETFLTAADLFVSPLPSIDVILGLKEAISPDEEPSSEENEAESDVSDIPPVIEVPVEEETPTPVKPTSKASKQATKPAVKQTDLQPTVVETPMVLEIDEEVDPELYVLEKKLGSGAISSTNQPEDEDLELFTELLEEEGLTGKAYQAKVGKFLEATYGKGYNSPEKIPSHELTNFIDHYVAYSGALKRLIDNL